MISASSSRPAELAAPRRASTTSRSACGAPVSSSFSSSDSSAHSARASRRRGSSTFQAAGSALATLAMSARSCGESGTQRGPGCALAGSASARASAARSGSMPCPCWAEIGTTGTPSSCASAAASISRPIPGSMSHMLSATTTGTPVSITCSARYRLRVSCVASTTSSTRSGRSTGGRPQMAAMASCSSALRAVSE